MKMHKVKQSALLKLFFSLAEERSKEGSNFAWRCGSAVKTRRDATGRVLPIIPDLDISLPAALEPGLP
jgi:hypothetical protein